MDQKRLAELLEEATVDCYDEEEEFWGVFTTLDDNLEFPLQARALGNVVEVVGLDGNRSNLRRGILAIVRQGEQEYPIGLAELDLIDPDPAGAEWLAMYRYWLGEE